MQIQYEVRRGSHGLGLFAMEDVKKGSMTWKATPGENVQLFSESDFQLIADTHCSAFVDRLVEISYGDPSLIVEGIVVPWDASQYTNHSVIPNCGSHESCGDDKIWNERFQDTDIVSHVYALRDIKSGEELTEDYSSFCLPAWYVEVMKKRNLLPTYYEAVPFYVPLELQCLSSVSRNLLSQEKDKNRSFAVNPNGGNDCKGTPCVAECSTQTRV